MSVTNNGFGGLEGKFKEGRVEILKDQKTGQITKIDFFLPSSAFNFGLNTKYSPNHENNQELVGAWNELINYKQGSEDDCEDFIDELRSAVMCWDIEKADLLHKWFKKVAAHKTNSEFCVYKLSGCFANTAPLQSGVEGVLSSFTQLMKATGKLPTKKEVRANYAGTASDVDKAIKAAGMNWLDNATHLRKSPSKSDND